MENKDLEAGNKVINFLQKNLLAVIIIAALLGAGITSAVTVFLSNTGEDNKDNTSQESNTVADDLNNKDIDEKDEMLEENIVKYITYTNSLLPGFSFEYPENYSIISDFDATNFNLSATGGNEVKSSVIIGDGNPLNNIAVTFEPHGGHGGFNFNNNAKAVTKLDNRFNLAEAALLDQTNPEYDFGEYKYVYLPSLNDGTWCNYRDFTIDEDQATIQSLRTDCPANVAHPHLIKFGNDDRLEVSFYIQTDNNSEVANELVKSIFYTPTFINLERDNTYSELIKFDYDKESKVFFAIVLPKIDNFDTMQLGNNEENINPNKVEKLDDTITSFWEVEEPQNNQYLRVYVEFGGTNEENVKLDVYDVLYKR